MKYAVNDEGIKALHLLSSHLKEKANNIFGMTSNLQNFVEASGNTIGPHKQSLDKAIKEIYANLKSSVAPIKFLSAILDEIAEGYQDIIDNNVLSLSDTALNTESTSLDVNCSSLGTQKVHKEHINNYSQQVSAVQKDVLAGSGKVIDEANAKRMLYAVQSFSRLKYATIRSAYKNPTANSKDVAAMQSLDEYINSAPKWEGQVYRGINISKETAEAILKEPTVDMLGPSSWSTDYKVAKEFSEGYRDVSMIFELADNKSGASITHIASWNSAEAEVTAPSGVIYHIDDVERTFNGDIETIIVKVHE